MNLTEFLQKGKKESKQFLVKFEKLVVLSTGCY